jgi:LPXTG-motif cell wall-anchored protein/uncharacterized repeat protein (TIGR01451 family)
MSIERPRRAVQLGALAAALAIAAGSLAAGSPVTQAAPGESQTPVANPDLPKACGIDIHVVLDESGSVKNYRRDVQTAFRAFTAALRNTGSRLAVSEFSTVARLPLSGPARYAFTPVTDQTIADTFEPYIANGYNPNGSTNWEDGFRVPRYLNEMQRANTSDDDRVKPDLVVFITDGNPNKVIDHQDVTYDKGNPSLSANEYENKVPLRTDETSNANANQAANRAVANSNGLKAQGAHILALAVGDGLSGSATLDRLKRISGPDVFDGTGTFDISTDDVYKEADFSKLEAALREAAFQLCAPSVTVRKLVDLTPDTGVSDALPGTGVDITASGISPTPSAWVQPSGATGTSATDSTDGNGFVNFQWSTPVPTASQVTITEEDPSTGPIPGLEYRPDLTACTYRTPDQPNDQTLAINPVTLGFSTTVPQDAIVTCTIYNVLPATPDIDIEKATNGSDADTVPGPSIPAGAPVTWTYVVTNTGTVTLTNVGVSDVPAATITCPQSTLAPNESMTCTASGTAALGQYTNTATATGTPPTGPNVTDADPSHYFGVAPGIDIEKATNREDADAAPGPLVETGDPVTWTYVVTNTGNVALDPVVVTDDQLGTITCPASTLAVGASMTCTASGTAVAGQYENLATATGTTPTGTVTDTDLSHYFGAAPAVDIEKLTNGEDADTPTGPLIEVGSNVLWIYRVTNTGNILLPTWMVTDDQGVTVDCPRVPLRPGDTATCFATGTAVAGQYSNIGTVDATDPAGTAVSDSDPSHYFGVDPSIQVEKATNGEDADAPTGPYVPIGDPVTWTYEITNTGNVALTDLDLFDTQLGSITCTLPVSLAPGASTTCTAPPGTATAGQYTNTAFVSGLDPLGRRVFDDDPSHYFGADPGIDVEKATNGVDGDEPIAPDGSLNGPYILVGDEVVWSYSVSNTGNETITDIELTDDQLGTITCPQTSLDPGESMDCTERTGIAQRTDTAPYVNIATVTGTPATGPDVTDSDPSHYWGYEPGVTIEKSTNGEDADTPTGPVVAVGDRVQWNYVVTNTGNVSIIAFSVTDSDPAVTVVCPRIGLLLPGSNVVCQASGTAIAGQYSNIATVDALDFFEDELTDTDPSHYFGAAPAIDIEKSTNGVDADQAPGPNITEGSLVTWRYVVTNTGNVDLVDLVVTDDRIGTISCPTDTLAVGASATCVATGTAVAGQYANIGTATAVTRAGSSPIRVTDSDPSHYNGELAAIPPQPPTTQPPTTQAPDLIPGGQLPATGSDGPHAMLTAGLLAALAGLVLLLIRRVGRRRLTS